MPIELTKEETYILERIKQYDKPIPEFWIHLEIEEDINKNKNYSPFEENKWDKIQLPRKYHNHIKINHLPYSQKLHDTIESLIEKGHILRNTKELTILLNPHRS